MKLWKWITLGVVASGTVVVIWKWDTISGWFKKKSTAPAAANDQPSKPEPEPKSQA